MLSLRLRRQGWRWLSPPVPALIQAWAEPIPSRAAPANALDFVVCDAEMSGLDPREAELLSLGWVRVSAGEVLLATARHQLVRNTQTVGQSAIVHGLRDCELAAARGLEAALHELLRATAGAVLVFHNAQLDLAFLNRAYRRSLGAPLLLPVVDTLRLEQRLLNRRGIPIAHGDLRLQTCRERYGLGAHSAHNALGDALATAELLLAQLAKRGKDVRLRDLL